MSYHRGHRQQMKFYDNTPYNKWRAVAAQTARCRTKMIKSY